MSVVQVTQNTDSLLRIADSLFTSKLRNGLNLYGQVRLNNEDSSNHDLDTLQLCQNKLARLLKRVRLSGRKSTKYLLENLKMKSVNQINCQIKLLEIWKSLNFADHPLKLRKTERLNDTIIIRACTNGRLIEDSKSNINNKTFKNDAILVWNQAPVGIKNCNTLFAAKKAFNKFVLK